MRISTISLALVSFLSRLILSAQQPVYSNCSLGKGTYTDSSVFHTNLNALLSNFSSDTKIDYGFYNSSYGESPNRVNALGLCRGDVKPETCRGCLKNATTILLKECPNQMEAFGYYDLCIFRYANRSIFGIYQDHDFSFSFNNPEKAQDAEKYTNALDDLMQSLRTKAAAGDSHLKVAMGNATAGGNETVYGLAQCTPDLSQQDCEDCLDKAISDISLCCQNKIGGRVIKLSCNLRFEKVHFYDSIQLSPATPALAPSSKTTSSPPGAADSPKASEGNNERTSRIVAIVAGVLGAFTTLY
ncbi:hypothetical protein QN277_001268 [Acacia crassicarpa]|uniref:Gnk2-homologous domain-containing protein n=1 Tax=Acacia crassicarpa TaxID=499986 RepID=A0AAE1TGW2_9FABA|nr:hypothetical protein QN277_001268 [Acacia crassicarpa]